MRRVRILLAERGGGVGFVKRPRQLFLYLERSSGPGFISHAPSSSRQGNWWRREVRVDCGVWVTDDEAS